MVTLNLVLFATQTLACPPIIGDCFVLPPDDEFNRPIDTGTSSKFHWVLFQRFSSGALRLGLTARIQ